MNESTAENVTQITFDKIDDYKKQKAKILSNWIINDLMGHENFQDIISPQELGNLADMVITGKISKSVAKDILLQSISSGKNISFFLDEASNAPSIEVVDAFCDSVIEENKDVVTKIKNGDTKSLSFLIGIVVRKFNRKVDAAEISNLLKKKISGM